MKYRILVFGLTNNIGGVENFFMNYYRKIDFSKYQIDFVTIYNDMAYIDELSVNGKVYVVSNYKHNPIKYYRQILKIMKNNHYDLVHVNLLSCANILPLKAAKRAKVKHIIAHSHNGDIPKGLLRRVLNSLNKKKLNKYATDYFACSKLAGDWMFTKPYVVINNKIDFNKFAFNLEKRNEIRDKYNLKDELVIGHVGKFCLQKNHQFFIEVLKGLNDKGIKAYLLLIGEGELKEEFANKVKENNLENQVIYTGMIDNAFEYYNAFDIFALPSLFEGLPLVGVEAQVNGLKCIFSDCITKELNISSDSQVKFVYLDSQKWVEEILNMDYKRVSNPKCDKSYDINGENLLIREYQRILDK